jgi:hypothetical protein
MASCCQSLAPPGPGTQQDMVATPAVAPLNLLGQRDFTPLMPARVFKAQCKKLAKIQTEFLTSGMSLYDDRSHGGKYILSAVGIYICYRLIIGCVWVMHFTGHTNLVTNALAGPCCPLLCGYFVSRLQAHTDSSLTYILDVILYSMTTVRHDSHLRVQLSTVSSCVFSPIDSSFRHHQI